MVQLYARSGGETFVNTATQDWQANPRITRLGTGGYVVTWTDGSKVGGDTSGYAVKGQIFDSAGGKVGGEFLVNTATSGAQMVESVATTASGGFVVVYLTENRAIKGQVFDSAGAKIGSEFLVTNGAAALSDANDNASVTALADGTIIVSWALRNGYTSPTGDDVFARAFSANGAALGAEFRLDSATAQGTSVSVTALASGGWVATWIAFSNSDWHVVGQVFAANGTKVGGEFTINSVLLTHYDGPNVVALAGGGFVVGWLDQDGPDINGGLNRGFKAQIFDAGGAKIGSEFPVNSLTTGSQANFDMDDMPGGGFVVTWTDESGLGGDSQSAGIMAQVFDSAGGKVGTQFLVNTITQGYQGASSVAALASGAFAVVWQSPPGPFQYDDIKSQLFVPYAGTATDIALSTASVPETSLGNYAVGILSDNGGVNSADTYTLVADSTGGGFRIEGNRLVVADNSRLDHETAPTASLTVRVTDSNGNSFDEVLSIAIADSAIEQRYTGQPEFTTVEDINGGIFGAALAGIVGGGFVMTWADDEADGGNNAGSIKAQLYDAAGAAVGGVIAVNSSTPNHQEEPSATGLALGGFVIVWEDSSQLGGDASSSGIKGQRFDSLGAKVGGEFLVNTITEGTQAEPSVAALANGGFVVSWTDRGDNSGDIKAQLYDWQVARVGGEFLVNTTLVFGSWGHLDSTVAALPAGGFVVSWTNSDSIHAQVFDQAGSKVGGELLVASQTVRWSNAQPTVAVLASGHFVVAWTDGHSEAPNQTGNFSSIQAQIFDSAGNKVGTQFLVNTATDYYQTNAAISALPWGGFVVSWQDQSYTGDDLASEAVRAQVFDATGVKVGTEFLVNQGVDNDQGVPFSTVLSSGGFVLGWKESYTDDVGAKVRYEGRVYSVAQADNSGNDTLIGDANANLLDGGAGNDQIYGNGGNDDLRGAAGNDWLHVLGTGFVAADGGGDFDYLEVNWGDATNAITMTYPNVDPNGGLMGTIGDGGARRVDYASINIFQITTGSGNDVLHAGQAGSSASMGGGDDRYWGAGGYETVDGGAGVDGVWAGLGLATSSIVWNLATNSFSGPIGSYTNIEYLLGGVTGSANDTITTTSANLNDMFSLGAGDDVATVLNGQDNFNGEFGNDLLIVDYSAATAQIVTTGFTLGTDSSGLQGGISDLGTRQVDFNNFDRFDVRTGSGNDIVVLGLGTLVSNDIVSLGGGDDYVDVGRGTDVADGGTGVDGLAADFSLATVAVSVNLTTNSFSGPVETSFVNFEYLPGTGLKTGSGNDIVVTGQLARSDIAALGAGADSMTVHNGVDFVDGQAGSDLLIIDYGAATVAVTTIGGAGGISLGTDGSGIKGQIGDGGTRRIDFDNVERFDVRTGSGNDNIVLGSGALATDDLVNLGDGDDFANFGRGLDQGDGGSGTDGFAADFTLAAGAIVVDLGLNGWSGPAGTGFINFEFLGNSSSRFVTGGGDDVVVTTAANLADFVSLGAGNDTATVKNGFDNVHGQGGSDLLIIDYGAATAAVTSAGGIAGATSGTGVRGQIGDGLTRRIDFDGFDRFDIRTGSGSDSITLGSLGLSTNDIVSLGGGDDAVDFGGGTDVGDGGAGVDSLAADLSSAITAVSINLATNSWSGPAGTSFVNFEYLGGSGFQTGQGADSVVTGLLNRNDRVALGAGNDSITFHDGQDTVFGGGAGAGATDSGFDTLVLDYGAATAAVHNAGAIQTNAAGAFGQIGDDSTRLATFQAIDRFLITTGSGNDSIATAAGNDEIRTGAGADSIVAGAGNDLLDGGGGADSMTGGGGDDVYVVDNGGDLVVEIAGEGTDEVRTALASFSLLGSPHVENLTATSSVAHDFRGNAANNVITGGAGSDVLRLYDGGNDTVFGGAGSDNIFFIGSLTAADVVNGGSETDTLVLQGPYGSLTLTANITAIENVSILGGNNTNFGEPGTNRYDYVLTTNDANFAAGLQVRINGAALLAGEDFTFDGSAETDAKFVVFGGKGVDTLTGGLGHDIFFYAEDGRFASGDTVNGGAGYDGMFLRGNYTIDFNAPGYTGLFTNIENLTLTSATDERYARGGGTEFDYDLVLSNAIVRPGETLTVSGALLMTTETMVLDASQEADGLLRLFGGRAADTLKGGALADLIHGNLGADSLTGNGGADTFRFDSTAESSSGAMDQILDFTPGTDKIDLSRVDANTLAAGDQGFSWIGSNVFTLIAGQLRAYEQGGTWFVEGDINGDAIADLVIALTLQGPTPLGAGDFIL